MLKKIDAFIAWVIILTGFAHCLSVFYYFQPIVATSSTGVSREAAFWWVSGGFNLMAGGALNLLRIRYGSLAGGITKVSVLINVLLLFYCFRLIANNPPFLTIPRILLGAFNVGAILFSVRSLVLLRRQTQTSELA